MENKEFAARLLVLERKANDLVNEIQVLFQDALDNEVEDEID